MTRLETTPGFVRSVLLLSPERPASADLAKIRPGRTVKGGKRAQVDEDCVSEGWLRLAVGKAIDCLGQGPALAL